MAPLQDPRLVIAENFFLYELNRVCDLGGVSLDFPISLRIIDQHEINAFATAGSFIFIYTGILKQLPDISEIMGVLCHELTHTKEHHIRRRVAQMDELNNQKMLMLAALPIIVLWPGIGEMIYTLSVDQAFLKQQQFSQQMEYEADAGAVFLMERAGFDSSKLISGFESIGRYDCHHKRPHHFSYYSSHPLTTDRIQRVKELRHDGSASPSLIYRSQMDYNLVLSLISSQSDNQTFDLGYTPLIDIEHKQCLADGTIETLLGRHPQSIVLTLEYWQQLRQQQRWDQLQHYYDTCIQRDPCLAQLPLIQEGLEECFYKTLSPPAFLRRYQKYLLDPQVSPGVMKYLAHAYQEQGNEPFYYLAQAKYYLLLGGYEEALGQLKHPCLDEHNYYYQTIQKEATLKNSTLEELSRR
jgi:predicted Zn-dependent protease